MDNEAQQQGTIAQMARGCLVSGGPAQASRDQSGALLQHPGCPRIDVAGSQRLYKPALLASAAVISAIGSFHPT
eukprot:CAMPEP_0181505234 /NCGR_PEP_ID=MMETSP1110-20121109/57947_1 /TAXON_ID=174948 /ORGANISM="Symbiodinium sp., Strain CCMP421" /LENGTH=73 /DNA_ID=CAMNT_0023634201 /DNA_START=516 /DNA_END=737 /DNA_ORIENTATION=-